jgi:hypothetical protein
MRRLTTKEIDRIATREGAQYYIVQRFLSQLPDDELNAIYQRNHDPTRPIWNQETLRAIDMGIRKTYRGG